MTNDEMNQVEWEDPDNWSDPVFGIYFSKRDTRSWVPKRVPSFGWTLNLGHRHAAWWLVGVMLVPAAISGILCRRARTQ